MADLGKIAITTADAEYDASTAYEKLTIVPYEGGLYLSKVDTQGHVPTDTTYWLCQMSPEVASNVAFTAAGTVTSTNVQGAIEQLDNLKQTLANLSHENVNDSGKYPSSALLYSINNALNTSLGNIKSGIATAIYESAYALRCSVVFETAYADAGYYVSAVINTNDTSSFVLNNPMRNSKCIVTNKSASGFDLLVVSDNQYPFVGVESITCDWTSIKR